MSNGKQERNGSSNKMFYNVTKTNYNTEHHIKGKQLNNKSNIKY